MDELAARVLTIGGPSALLALAVYMVLTGRLVPKWIYEAKVREAEKWERAAELNAETLRTSQQHEAELLELSRTGIRVLSSLPQPEEVTTRVPMDHTPPT